jgi:hypothetical protein
MAVDIGRILVYADLSGAMHDTPRRTHLVLVDGIVAGEGDGPLSPRPVPAGTLVFSEDVALGDVVCAMLMGYDPERLRIVHEPFAVRRFRLSASDPLASLVVVNGRAMPVGALRPVIGRSFAPPSGWRGFLERQQDPDDIRRAVSR